MSVAIECLRAGVTLSTACGHTAWNRLAESSRCGLSLGYILPLSTSFALVATPLLLMKIKGNVS